MPETDVRVVVTGLGVIAPTGKDTTSFGESLCRGVSGVRTITQFDCNVRDPRTGNYQFASRIAGEVPDFQPESFLPRANRYDRASQLAIYAARMAFESAGLDSASWDAGSVGVVMGTGMGDMRTVEAGTATLLSRGANHIPPTYLPKVLPSLVPGNVSIFFGLNGPSLGLSSACASATHATGEAYWMLRRGDARILLAGGAEASITPLTVASFSVLRVMSCRNDDPRAASRPFDLGRDGFVIGEGSGMLVLETLDSAKSRGAHIYAEILGYGLTSDAFHASSMRPDGAQCARAIRLALERARISPDDISYINAHGTSTRMNDILETRAIKQALGEQARRIPVSATKSMTGHLMSGAGSVELVACILMMRDQVIHPTINLGTPDPECDLDYVPGVARQKPVDIILKNSFGFGGQNAVLVLKRWTG